MQNKPTIPPETAGKLVKILGLLGSDQPGERAAAGWQAHKIIAACNVSWGDLLLPSLPVPSHDYSARDLIAIFDCWNQWEWKFLTSIAVLGNNLTPKQRATLENLRAKAGEENK